jgi:putative aldouronate transport system permease protein
MRRAVSTGSRVFDVVNGLFLLGFVLVTLYPFYYVFITSISDGIAVMRQEVVLLPKGVNLASYRIIFQDPHLGRSYLNTLYYTGLGTAINVVCTICGAYPLSRKRFVARKFFTGLILFTMFFGGGLIPTYLVVMQLGLLNSVWAIVLPGAVGTYNLIIMRTFFQSIPDSLYEASFMDGANDLRILVTVVLPLSVPIIATMILFYAVGHWNSFFSAIIYLKEKARYPAQVFLRNIVVSGDLSTQNSAIGSGGDFLAVTTTVKYAVIMVVSIPIICVYPFLQRYFVKGIMIGSLKG